jgi:SUKH-3 immunity protein of toxin-antitoxin system
MSDPNLQPSPEAGAILSTGGWSPERTVDISEWREGLAREGNTVFPLAEAVLRQFGGLRFQHTALGGPSRQDFDVNPALWFGMRDEVEEVEQVLQARVCPVGEASGAAMLAVLEDGRVIAERDGDVVLLGESWPAALDRLLLGRGDDVTLAENWERSDTQTTESER